MKLNLVHCTYHEHVLYVSNKLEGNTGDWWDACIAAHADVDDITWDEFHRAFRKHHIPAGLKQQKKKEVLSLKKRGMSVI